MLFIGGQNALGGLLGLIPATAQIEHFGTPGLEIGLSGLVDRSLVQDGESLVVFALALVGPAQTQDGRRGGGGVFEQGLILADRFLVVAVQQTLAGGLERRASGQPSERGKRGTAGTGRVFVSS